MPCNRNLTANSSFALGCRHYSRGCRLRASCCNELFWVSFPAKAPFGRQGAAHVLRAPFEALVRSFQRYRLIAPVCGVCWQCRWCHNEIKDEGCPDPKKAHAMDRFAVERVQCARCEHEQDISPQCEGCGAKFGEYYCSICKFFDNDSTKGTFHCEGCGICRIGGRDNFFHCSACGCCYAMQLFQNHRCIQGAMHHNCPVCLEVRYLSRRWSAMLLTLRRLLRL